ncbi:MAG: biotin--[Paludibacteraceae bacterium]|nr:biotin--[acetyl-CoA-carboxylase] ligase [Paludibacteraceae bacterium]
MYLSECDSTNTRLKQLLATGQAPDYIYAGYQTAGRGQTGNGWESERGKNLICSILVESQKVPSGTPINVESLFDLNVAVSVAVHRAVTGYGLQVTGDGLQVTGYGLRVTGDEVTIKWPNDIYWKDKKLAGILVENAIIGNEVRYAIAGIGLNVNQTEFRSDAPNPISLRQITGRELDVHELMRQLLAAMHAVLAEPEQAVWDYYRAHLYRREGYWPYVEREVSTEPTMNANSQEPIAKSLFRARIEDVLPTGELVLRDEEGKQRIYHFKQVRYVL